jgi:hypothetical protein
MARPGPAQTGLAWPGSRLWAGPGKSLIEKLEGVSVGMWNGPLDEEKPSYLFVDVVGAFEEYHVPTVSGTI